MLNKDVFEKMSEKFGTEAMPQVCLTLSYVFELAHEEASEKKVFSDLDHDRDWWKAKYNELVFRADDSNESDDLTSSK